MGGGDCEVHHAEICGKESSTNFLQDFNWLCTHVHKTHDCLPQLKTAVTSTSCDRIKLSGTYVVQALCFGLFL